MATAPGDTIWCHPGRSLLRGLRFELQLIDRAVLRWYIVPGAEVDGLVDGAALQIGWGDGSVPLPYSPTSHGSLTRRITPAEEQEALRRLRRE